MDLSILEKEHIFFENISSAYINKYFRLTVKIFFTRWWALSGSIFRFDPGSSQLKPAIIKRLGIAAQQQIPQRAQIYLHGSL